MAEIKRGTKDDVLDPLNDQIRSSKAWQDFMRARGYDLSRPTPIQLSGRDQKDLKAVLEREGFKLQRGMEIDKAGNINGDEGFSKYWDNPYIRYPVLAGGALATAGALGAGPLAGIMGGGGGGAAATGGGIGAFSHTAPSLASALGAAPTAAGAAAGGAVSGIGGGALNFLKGNWRDLAGAGGKALGAISETQANNRGAQFDGQMEIEREVSQRDRDHFDQTIKREEEGRASGTDAWRKLLSAQRTLSPSQRPMSSPYSVAPRQATDAERTGADAMTAEVMARLQGGNQIPKVERRPLSVDPRLLQAGRMETATGYLSPILSFLGGRR